MLSYLKKKKKKPALLICVHLANRKCMKITGIIRPRHNFSFSKFAASYSTVLLIIEVIRFPVPPEPENTVRMSSLFHM